ncbi:MAG: hypothetical protein K0S81_336, partial [Rhodospirillales bacterium]|nr:hypothetical protein [Rhodospirillales bacterium]
SSKRGYPHTLGRWRVLATSPASGRGNQVNFPVRHEAETRVVGR